MSQHAPFLTLLRQLHCTLPTAFELWQQLIAAYSEPHRHYHTMEHLEECLQLLDYYKNLAHHPAEIAYALWFHDAIYQPHATNNEQNSAAWAICILQQGGVSAIVQERVYGLILATQHGIMLPYTHDEQLLVDIDLAIFAAPPHRFTHYQQQIRAEYAHVPDALYQQKRREFLVTFQQSDKIYHIPEIYADLEQRARLNVQHALTALKYDPSF